MNSSSDAVDIDQLISYLKNIESRISRIEKRLDLDEFSSDDKSGPPPIILQNISERADNLESQIGQFWFAKAGIAILSIGIIYLLTFPYANLPSSAPSIIGFFIACGLFILSRLWRNNLQYISQYLFGVGLLLLYFTTLRLRFFSEYPAVTNELLEIILLTLITIVHLYIAYKKQSVYLNSIGITLASVTALLSNNSYSIFIYLLMISILIVYLKLKYDWNGFYIYGITLVFLTQFLWFINNPVLGNKIELQALPYISVFSLLLYGIIFSFGNLFIPKDKSDSNEVIVSTIINCFWCYSFFLFITIAKYNNIFAVSHFIASILFLTLSISFWLKHECKYATFFYSILGYTALSVAIIAQFPKPDFFIWLCWQSVLVVSTAIWFRSKIIIVANFIMYLLIFFSHLVLADKIGIVTLSFGIVAIVSARILNSQKHRLDLKTEAMRLFYLGSAFFIFPYALYHIVPKDYVGISWTVVALIYYVISVILKNKKYRWMSLLTFLLTVLYILFVGTTNFEPVYRIISFIALGVILLGISILYSKVKSKLK